MHFRLPNLHATWPFPKTINPHYSQASAESLRWIDSFQLFSEANREKFHGINAGLLGALAYPHHNKEQLRVACDLMNVLFAVDEVSDDLDGEDAQKLAELVITILNDDEFRNPGADHPVTKLHQSFFKSVRESMTPTAFKWFVKDYQTYLEAMVHEAKDREGGTIKQSVDEYLSLRRYTGAIKPSFDMIFLPLNLPDEVLHDQRIMDLEMAAIDMIAVANDVVSFNVEQARGDIHNLAIVLMDSRKIGVQESMNAVGEWYHQRAREFVSAMNDLPTSSELFGKENANPQLDEDVRKYVWGLGNWVTANYEWSFESERFWGSAKLEESENGGHEIVVELMQQQKAVAAAA